MQRVENEKEQYIIENSDSRDLSSHLKTQVSRLVTFA